MDAVSTGAPFFRPWIGREEIDAVTTVLLSGATAGHATSAEFERLFARYVDAAYAVSVNSTAAAVTLALEAVGIRPGDDVITSPYVSFGMASVVRALRARIVLADVDPQTGGLSPAAVARRVTPATRVIIAPHTGGVPCDVDGLMAIGARCGIAIVGMARRRSARGTAAGWSDRSDISACSASARRATSRRAPAR
jgi:dTDP-4-amino-4,6-dideoxygalactose transaminase